MTTALATRKESAVSLAMNEDELINVLRNSLFPGAQPDSIKLVIGYCKASGLDPMQKPVHIVPMYAATGAKDAKGYDIKAMRDVIMPGIGLYRTQASRSGQYAGVSEPEFGEDVTEELGSVSVTYPKWCRVTVKRQMENGTIVDFTAKEFWTENYATKGKDSSAPNAMWAKRPYGQIAKCTEAQALRKAFPEFGAQPTADEMEGKQFDDVTSAVIDGSTGEVMSKPKELPAYTDAQMDANLNKWQAAINEGKTTPQRIMSMIGSKFKLSTEQESKIRGMKKEATVDPFIAEMEAAEQGEQE